jgi:hypothetical protein
MNILFRYFQNQEGILESIFFSQFTKKYITFSTVRRDDALAFARATMLVDRIKKAYKCHEDHYEIHLGITT